MTAIPDPFPVRPYDARFTSQDTSFIDAVASVGRQGRFKGLGFALVDLTDNKRTYAGVNDLTEYSGASMVKIAAMYAAIELREAVQRALPAVGSRVERRFFAELEGAWRDKAVDVLKDIPSTKPGAVPRLAERQWPLKLKLERIFRIEHERQGLPSVEFRTSGLTNKPLYQHHKKSTAATLEFESRMKLMVGASDNIAADSCIRDLGFQYINAALIKGGFFNNSAEGESGGLWLGRFYDPGSGKAVAAKFPKGLAPKDTDLWARAPGVAPSPGQGATARSVARFMTLVATGGLVSDGGSRVMRTMLDKLDKGAPGAMSVSWFGYSTQKPPIVHGIQTIPEHGLSTMLSKLGFGTGDGNVYTDCAYVERTTGAKRIEYVMVALGAGDPETLAKLAIALDTVIVARNSN